MNKLRVKIGCPTDIAYLCERCRGWHPNYTALAEGERERIAREWLTERLGVLGWEDDGAIPEFGLVTKDAVLAVLFPEEK